MREAIALAGLAACGTPELENADGPPSRELAVERVEDLGRFPEPSARVIGRDGGPGGMLGGKLLWTFGDSFTDAANPVDGSNVLSATAGWSTVDAPLALVQPVDAGGSRRSSSPTPPRSWRRTRPIRSTAGACGRA